MALFKGFMRAVLKHLLIFSSIFNATVFQFMLNTIVYIKKKKDFITAFFLIFTHYFYYESFFAAAARLAAD